MIRLSVINPSAHFRPMVNTWSAVDFIMDGTTIVKRAVNINER